MLRRKGLLTPERTKLMRSWAHSGFNVNAQVRIGADDATGLENLAHNLIRAPFSMNKIRYDAAAAAVVCRSAAHIAALPALGGLLAALLGITTRLNLDLALRQRDNRGEPWEPSTRSA